MKDLIQSIESRFQLLVTLSIFFSSLIYFLGKATGETDAQAVVALFQFGGLIGLVLVDYIIFHSTKDRFSETALLRIDQILLISLAVFAAPILILAVAASIKQSQPLWVAKATGLTLGTSVVIVLAVPVVIELVLIISSLVSERKRRRNKK